MSIDWKKRKCKDCDFCINRACRRLPPSWIEPWHEREASAYPDVYVNEACFEFRDKK